MSIRPVMHTAFWLIMFLTGRYQRKVYAYFRMLAQKPSIHKIRPLDEFLWTKLRKNREKSPYKPSYMPCRKCNSFSSFLSIETCIQLSFFTDDPTLLMTITHEMKKLVDENYLQFISSLGDATRKKKGGRPACRQKIAEQFRSSVVVHSTTRPCLLT